MPYARDGRPVNAKASRQGKGGFRAISDFACIVNRKLAVGIQLTTHARVTTLPLPILHVVDCRSDEEMGRIHAGGIVAMVANVEVVRRRTVGKHPRYAMRPAHLTLETEAPIATRNRGVSPFPTSGGFSDFNLRPEAFCGRLAISHWAPPVPVVRGRRERKLSPVPISLAQASA